MIYGNYLRDKYNNTALKIADAEGVPCVMEYSKGKNLRNYEIYGNSVQDGTPSPDTPIEIQSVGDLVTDTASEYYGKYDVPITVRGKNLLPNSDWMSGTHSNGFTEQTNVNYITEYTQNSISFNLAAWKGVSSPRFLKDRVKRIVFKINQNQINSDDGYINFYIIIQGYDDNNNKVGSQAIYNNAIADTEYVFDFSAISTSNFYKNSTQFSFCILARKNALSNLMVYDIAYYADTDTTEYEPYVKPTITHIYLNEPLRKVGDYADYIDFKNQKVVRNINSMLIKAMAKLNNNETNETAGFYFRVDDRMIINDSTNIQVLSPSLLGVPRASFSEDTSLITAYPNNSVIAFKLSKTLIGGDTTVLVNKYLENNPITIYYILATPVEEDITIPGLKTFKGTSIMLVDTSIQPSNIKTKYVKL